MYIGSIANRGQAVLLYISFNMSLPQCLDGGITISIFYMGSAFYTINLYKK